jgi:glycosyltransferase involved in cell wall biosynthesis
MPTFSVLINTYNYGRYLPEAIASVLAQTRPADQIVVVDDGSTDDTPARLAPFRADPRFTLIRQINSGQLAAFVAGIEAATGDLLAFLDADDVYAPEHLATLEASFTERRDVDFIGVGHHEFGTRDRPCPLVPAPRDLGISCLRTYFTHCWLGTVTSALACRRATALALLPTLRAAAPRWRVRADDCLVVGSSLVGARKLFLPALTVRYRLHGENHFHARVNAEVDDHRHWLRRQTFVHRLAADLGLVPAMGDRLDVEFRTLAQPDATDYADYQAAARAWSGPVFRKLKLRLNLRRHYRAPRAAA